MPFLASEAVEAATVEDAVDEAKLTILDPELFEEAGFACPAPEFPEFRLDFSSSVITVEFATFFNWLLLAFLLSLESVVEEAVVEPAEAVWGLVWRVGVCWRPEGGREATTGGVGVLWRIERLEISWSRLITVGVEEVVVETTVAGFALFRALKNNSKISKSRFFKHFESILTFQLVLAFLRWLNWLPFYRLIPPFSSLWLHWHLW